MSSTRNSQNLLVNVFRPTYVYDGCGFTAGVVATNLKTLDVSLVRATTVTMGDPGGNVYIGTGSGISYSPLLSNSNVTAIGANAAAAISNVQTSVFIGANSGVASINSSNTVIVGANANAFGTKNIILGNGSYLSGSNNIVIGSDISLNTSYTLKIGNILTADLSTNATKIRFDTCVGVLRDPSYSLDVSGNFRISDPSGSLVYSNGNVFSTGYLTSNGNSTMTTGGTAIIYPIKRGLFTVISRNIADAADYIFGDVFIRDTCLNLAPVLVDISRGGGLDLAADNDNIKLVNSNVTTMNTVWSLKYQPL